MVSNREHHGRKLRFRPPDSLEGLKNEKSLVAGLPHKKTYALFPPYFGNGFDRSKQLALRNGSRLKQRGDLHNYKWREQ